MGWLRDVAEAFEQGMTDVMDDLSDMIAGDGKD